VNDGLQRMRELVNGLPEQLENGWRMHRSLDLPFRRADIDTVVVAGMGGSAISADTAAMLFAAQLPVPLITVRDYALPAWAGARTLLVSSSWSGETEETLTAYAEGARRGCMRVAVTTGGKLADLARSDGVAVVLLPPVGPPRAALGGSLAAVAAVLHAVGLIPDPTDALSACAGAMHGLVAVAASPAADPTRAVVDALHERIPFVYAPDDMTAVARRWKTQINENAKATACWDTLPELNHNSVVGYELPKGLTGSAAVVLLRGASESARMALRYRVTAEILRSAGIPALEVAAPAAGRGAEAMWLLQFGDLVSVGLAERSGVDPMPVDVIVHLKKALSEAP
jgi:glucose/mannose-6-phosphate isomerase